MKLVPWACNYSTWEVDAGKWGVQGQSWLNTELETGLNYMRQMGIKRERGWGGVGVRTRGNREGRMGNREGRGRGERTKNIKIKWEEELVFLPI